MSASLQKPLKALYSKLSLVFGKVNAQIADGFLDFFDLYGNIPGEFLLVLDDFIDEKLQFPHQVDRKYQGKAFIRC